jgi:hypothetical protein
MQTLTGSKLHAFLFHCLKYSILYIISPTHDFYTLDHLMHCSKYVKEKLLLALGPKNPFRGPHAASGPYVAHAWPSTQTRDAEEGRAKRTTQHDSILYVRR